MDVIFEHNLAAYLWIVFGPVLLVIGIFGNCLSLIVLIGPSFAKNSAAFGLSALAVVDTGVLVVSLLRQWIYYLTDGFDVRVLFFSFGCKFQAFLSYFLSQLSSWTVVMVTIERALSVLCPLTVRSRITRSRTILFWVFLSCIIFLINAHFFWTIELFLDIHEYDNQTSLETTPFYESKTTRRDELSLVTLGYTRYYVSNQTSHPGNQNAEKYLCFFKIDYLEFSATVLPWLDFFLTVAIPFLLIAFFNILIAICVWRTVSANSLYRHHPSTRQSFRESLSAEENAGNNHDSILKRLSNASDNSRHRRRSSSCANLKFPDQQERRAKKENKSRKCSVSVGGEDNSDHYSDVFYAGARCSRDERNCDKSFNHDKQKLEQRVSNESHSFLKSKFGRPSRDGQQRCSNSPASQSHPPCTQKLSFQSVALSTPRKQFSVRKRDQILAPFTAMLVGLGVMFLMTNAPSGVYFILQESLFAKIADNDDYSKVGPLRLAYAIVNILYFVNHSANFLLYCLTGSKFRMALRKTLRCQKKPIALTQIKLTQKPLALKTPNSRCRCDRGDSEPRGYDDSSLRGFSTRHHKFATMNAF